MKKELRKITAFFLAAVFMAITVNAFATTNFTDLSPEHWAYGYISALADTEIISGYEDGTFRADNKVTRAQWAKILSDAGELNTENTFLHLSLENSADLSKSHWAAAYMVAAKDYMPSYMINDAEYYYPDREATREEVAVSLVKFKGYTAADNSALSAFADLNDISAESARYIAAAVENGLISGFEDGTFRPNDSLTRAEASTLVCKAFGIDADTSYALNQIPYYGDRDKCIMDKKMAQAYAQVLENQPYEINANGETYALKALLMDVAGDGMPLLITTYESVSNPRSVAPQQYFDLSQSALITRDDYPISVWTWDGNSAGYYDFASDCETGVVAGYAFYPENEYAMIRIRDGYDEIFGDALNVGLAYGDIDYTVKNAQIIKVNSSMQYCAIEFAGEENRAWGKILPEVNTNEAIPAYAKNFPNANLLSPQKYASVHDLTDAGWVEYKNDVGNTEYYARYENGQMKNYSDYESFNKELNEISNTNQQKWGAAETYDIISVSPKMSYTVNGDWINGADAAAALRSI